MTVSSALQKSALDVRNLVELSAGLRIENWIAAGGGFTNTFKSPLTLNILSVWFNVTTALTLRASIALVDANAGSWFSDGTYIYVRPPTGESMYGNAVNYSAMIGFYFADKAGVYNGRFYNGRLRSAPSISLRIDETFGGVGQFGGGTLALINNDGYFTALKNLQWDAGRAVLKFGGNTTFETMAYADYATLATWLIDSWTATDTDFILKLREVKSRINRKVPFDYFDKATFPNLPTENLNKPIPIAYGVIRSINPVLVDAGLKKFKVAGHAIKSFDLVRIHSNNQWINISFASKNLADATFTLGGNWNGTDELAVDFTGKTSGGTAITNSADIVKDLLATIGETDINAASFTAGKNALDLGFSIEGRTEIRKCSVYITVATDLLNVISTINKHCGSYLFCDANGQYHFGVFSPITSENSSAKITDIDVQSFVEETENESAVSKIISNYDFRAQEEFNQVVIEENKSVVYQRGSSTPIISELNLLFVDDSDARALAQDNLIELGRAHKRYRITIHWKGMFILPGDQILIEYAKQSFSAVCEVYEIKYDVSGAKVSLSVGNLRGFGNQPGFLVEDADVLPVRFADLAGYGSGSLTWNASWNSTIKAWVKANVGYWTEDSGHADASDSDSQLASVFV